MPISISVNVDKVDKKKLYKGKKGRYLDLYLWETPDSDYGDYLVKQRGQGDEKLPILGNGKYFKPEGKKTKAKASSGDEEEESGDGIF